MSAALPKIKPVRPELAASEQVFWDRIEDMPDIEARSELDIRKEKIALENAMLVGEKARASISDAERLGIAIQENNALLTKINARRRLVNDRMDRLEWKNAVKAIYGEEGVFKCLEWMEVNR